MVPIVTGTPRMSGQSDAAEIATDNPIKRISPPEHKKKRKDLDRHVKQNQTGLSSAEMQRSYKKSRRKKKHNSLDPSYVQAVFDFASENDSLYVPQSRIPTSPIELERTNDDIPTHVCTESTPSGRGATRITSHFHENFSLWSKECESKLRTAIINNIDNGPFGRIHWKNVALAMGGSHCHVQCSVRWQRVKELFDNREENARDTV